MRDYWRRFRRWGARMIEDWRGGTTILLEIVRECNQRCVYCYRLPESAETARHLAPAELDTVLSRLADHFGRLRLTLTGGEPTLHPDLETMVRACVALDPATTMITNLSTMDVAMGRRLAAAGLQKIQVTFLSPIPAEHDSLCGAGSFDRWLAGLAAAREAGLTVGAILLVTRSTVRRVRESLQFMLGLGLGSFMVNRYNGGFPGIGGRPSPGSAQSCPTADNPLPTSAVPAPAATDPASLFLTREDLDRFLADLEEVGARWNLTIPLGVPIPSCLTEIGRFPHLEFSACPIGRSTGMYWAVGADGALRACNHLPDALGNLLTTRVSDILTGAPWADLRRRLACPPAICGDCSSFTLCRGGCRGAARTWGGTVDGLDPWVEQLLANSQGTGGRDGQ